MQKSKTKTNNCELLFIQIKSKNKLKTISNNK